MDAKSFFEGEEGGHRWQRIPPTEKRGRVQTSTVTVAVLPAPDDADIRFSEKDLSWSFFAAGGPGGQHQNKTASACRVTHLPSKLAVECRSERSQHQNKRIALSLLQSRLTEKATTASAAGRNQDRKDQLGSGERGDKTRTYRVKDDVVTDHRSGKKTSLSKILKGDWSGLKE